jgi:hypothetical protein
MNLFRWSLRIAQHANPRKILPLMGEGIPESGGRGLGETLKPKLIRSAPSGSPGRAMQGQGAAI